MYIGLFNRAKHSSETQLTNQEEWPLMSPPAKTIKILKAKVQVVSLHRGRKILLTLSEIFNVHFKSKFPTKIVFTLANSCHENAANSKMLNQTIKLQLCSSNAHHRPCMQCYKKPTCVTSFLHENA